tara:strand:+ start:4389 stop:4919 length:531 start_codon:yes stop_codon:yes gene_type:complete
MTSIYDARPEPTRILKVPKKLTPCHSNWLPTKDSLDVPIQAPQPRKKIWFPEDQNGEPHSLNPDDGCGGSKFKLSTTKAIYVTSDGKVPTHNLSNVLEGSRAFKAHRAEKKARNDLETSHLYKRLVDNLNLGKKTKFEIWRKFQKKIDRLQEPNFSLVGRAWRTAFGRAPRFEEHL